MGLTYGYDVYLRPRNVAGALAAVAELAPPSRDVPPLDVTLPGGERITLPFTSGFRSEPVDCSSLDTLDLDTSLVFPVDDAVRAYAQSYGLPPEENGRVRIGYVYLTVRFRSFLDPRYTSLEFWAATSGMSRLFERSASIRGTFTDLAAAVGAECCQFDVGDGSPGEVCWVSGEAGFPPGPPPSRGSA
ncbi:hypothetical protein KBY91_19360 [Streptomyces sp. RK23]|uniref:hypothetical protein n=1 Tax=unclassified Streptomyces TaxID=2593676 RepID=UPI001B3779FE|nr:MULTISPECIES: hypothetical protein [unclassified Streptomyces]MBQ0963509.1 hypothetical protein [Streptomyces sp. RK74B]MBQ1005565.1 hypothetical protein [Streptomyces sp. RK23]